MRPPRLGVQQTELVRYARVVDLGGDLPATDWSDADYESDSDSSVRSEDEDEEALGGGGGEGAEEKGMAARAIATQSTMQSESEGSIGGKGSVGERRAISVRGSLSAAMFQLTSWLQNIPAPITSFVKPAIGTAAPRPCVWCADKNAPCIETKGDVCESCAISKQKCARPDRPKPLPGRKPGTTAAPSSARKVAVLSVELPKRARSTRATTAQTIPATGTDAEDSSDDEEEHRPMKRRRGTTTRPTLNDALLVRVGAFKQELTEATNIAESAFRRLRELQGRFSALEKDMVRFCRRD